MDKHRLPKTLNVHDTDIPIKSDFRDILYLFQIFEDKDLLDQEKFMLAMENFYETDDYLLDCENACKQMILFINAGQEDEPKKANEKQLYDWDKDFNIIVAPINKILNYDVRGVDYLHWWTFLSAFMEIGECTFSTFVGIRDKLSSGKRLDKTEKKFYNDNKSRIDLVKKYDSVTQNLMDAILGKE